MVKKKTCQVGLSKGSHIQYQGPQRKKRGSPGKVAFGLGTVQKSMAGRDGERMIIMMGHAFNSELPPDIKLEAYAVSLRDPKPQMK